MTTLSAATLRKQFAELPTGLRGYSLAQVSEYVDRLASAVEVLTEEDGPDVDFPAGLSPEIVRTREFSITWRGYDRDTVRRFLNDVADQLSALRAEPKLSAVPLLQLPANFETYAAEIKAKGVFTGAHVAVGERAVRVTFMDPNAITARVADDLAKDNVALFPNLIAVAEVTESEMQAAFSRLQVSGALRNLLRHR